jgi:enamine deaminase RidA (YjgF/YER057c/UK114 family)
MTEARRINVSSGRPLEAKAHYSRALRVGDTVLQSGTTAINREGDIIGEGDVSAQVDAIMDLARESMGLAEGHFEDVVRARLYVTEPTLLQDAGQAFARYFADVRPVLSPVTISRLARPTQLIEIELEAVDGASESTERYLKPDTQLDTFGASDAVRIGDRVLVSGQPSGRAASAEGEIRGVLRSVRELLEHLGATWDDLVYTKTFLPSMAEVETVTQAFARALDGVRPVGTLLGSPRANGSGGRFLIEAEAVLGAAQIRRDHGEAPFGPFSESVSVGGRIYLSTQSPLDASGNVVAKGDWSTQNDHCVRRLEQALCDIDASLADIVTRRVFTHTDAEMNRAYGEGPAWFEPTCPAALGCRVPEHVHPDISVCVEGFAVRGAGKSIEWRSLRG